MLGQTRADIKTPLSYSRTFTTYFMRYVRSGPGNILRHLSATTILLQRILCNMLGQTRADIKTPLSYNHTLQHILCNRSGPGKY